MAKYITGTAVAAPGAVDVFYQIIRAHLTSNGWTEHKVITDTLNIRDIVFRGAALDLTADNRPFVRIFELEDGNNHYIEFRTYTDWDPTSASPSGGGVNEAGGSSSRLSLQNASFNYYIRANSVSMLIVAKVAAAYPRMYAGFLRRKLRPHMAGLTKSAGAITAGTGPNVNIALSSDMTGKWYVGQTVWVMNHAHNILSANASRCEAHVISAIGSSTVQFAEAISGNFDADAMIGENPMPACVTATGTSGGLNAYHPLNSNATRTTSTAQTSTNDYQSWEDGPTEVPGVLSKRFSLKLVPFYQNVSGGNGGTMGSCYHTYITINSASSKNLEDVGDDKNGKTYLLWNIYSQTLFFIGPREG